MNRVLRRLITAGAVACVLAPTANANDDDNLLLNPGFEVANPDNESLPLGWNGINVGGAEYVDIMEDEDVYVHSGSRAIMLPPTSGSAAFRGWTTNFLLPDGSDLYDPDYVYLGGDVHIIGYYLIPAGETITNEFRNGIKLEFRREPPNFSIYTAVEFDVPLTTTNGKWVRFEATFTDEQMAAVGDFPPYATSVTVLPQRFWNGSPTTGRIFWDDLCLIQGDLGGCNDADLAEPFNSLDFSDVLAFLVAFGNMDAAADLAPPFGSWDFSDVLAFLTAFGNGCP
ncbi:MAG: GC-type dockerin domain-anchored protein [Phycisphaerales bacterium]